MALKSKVKAFLAARTENISTKRGFFNKIQQKLEKPKPIHPSEEAEIVIIPEDEASGRA